VEGEWTTLQVPFTDDDALADEVSGYGADVVVVEPAEVRDLVVARLRGALAAHRAVTGGAA
jgi:proteasome accessory factor B